MEDEEGYMTLVFRPRKEQSQKPTSQVQDASQGSRWHWIALWIGWALNVTLVAILIMLAFQTRQLTNALERARLSQRQSHGAESSSCLENTVHWRQFLCKIHDNNTAENSSCAFCHHNWFLHKNKCYWISKEKQQWHQSKEDCTAKLSQLFVIQNQEEVDFIQNITSETQPLWIGLAATVPERNWTWVDGSPLDDKRLQELGPADANSCGILTGTNIISDTCTAVTMWICETKALLI